MKFVLKYNSFTLNSPKHLKINCTDDIIIIATRGVAQLEACQHGALKVAGSSPVAPTNVITSGDAGYSFLKRLTACWPFSPTFQPHFYFPLIINILYLPQYSLITHRIFLNMFNTFKFYVFICYDYNVIEFL